MTDQRSLLDQRWFWVSFVASIVLMYSGAIAYGLATREPVRPSVPVPCECRCPR